MEEEEDTSVIVVHLDTQEWPCSLSSGGPLEMSGGLDMLVKV